MGLIVEDGTGLPNAESYISVADTDQYFSDRGNTSWAALTTARKEGLLRVATEYMMGMYRTKWLGRRTTIQQTLDWPRVGVVLADFNRLEYPTYGLLQVDYRIVPVEVKRACAELALRASIGVLVADSSQKVIQETVGPITVKYDPYATDVISYRQVDNMISVYLLAGGNTAMIKLSRV